MHRLPEDPGIDNDAPEEGQEGNDGADQQREPFDPADPEADQQRAPFHPSDDVEGLLADVRNGGNGDRDAEFEQEGDVPEGDVGLVDPRDAGGNDMADGYGTHGRGRTRRQKHRQDPVYNPDKFGDPGGREQDDRAESREGYGENSRDNGLGGHQPDDPDGYGDSNNRGNDNPDVEFEPNKRKRRRREEPNDAAEHAHGFENRRIDDAPEDIEVEGDGGGAIRLPADDPAFQRGMSHNRERNGGSRRQGGTAVQTFHRPGDAHKCGAEDDAGGHCRCTGTAWYGHGDKWVSKQSHGSIQCSNDAFHGDPYPSRMKSCYCQTGVLSRSAGHHASTKARRRRDDEFVHSSADEESEFGGGITSMFMVMMALFGVVVFIVLFRFNGQQQPSGFRSRSQKHTGGRWRGSWGGTDKSHMAKYI